MDQINDIIYNIRNNNLPQSIDRAVEQSILLVFTQVFNNIVDQIPIRDSIIAAIS